MDNNNNNPGTVSPADQSFGRGNAATDPNFGPAAQSYYKRLVRDVRRLMTTNPSRR